MLFSCRSLCNGNSFLLLTFVTKSFILNAERVLDLSITKHTCGMQVTSNSFIDASTVSNMDELISITF